MYQTEAPQVVAFSADRFPCLLIMDRYLFDLLRWTSELIDGARRPDWGAELPEIDNSTRGHKDAQKAQKLACLTLFPHAPYSGRSLFEGSKTL